MTRWLVLVMLDAKDRVQFVFPTPEQSCQWSVGGFLPPLAEQMEDEEQRRRLCPVRRVEGQIRNRFSFRKAGTISARCADAACSAACGKPSACVSWLRISPASIGILRFELAG